MVMVTLRSIKSPILFGGTQYTTENFEWVWHDGKGAPKPHKELRLPNKEKLPLQGAMFIGEKETTPTSLYEATSFDCGWKI